MKKVNFLSEKTEEEHEDFRVTIDNMELDEATFYAP